MMTRNHRLQRFPDRSETSQSDAERIHMLNTLLSAATEFVSLFDKRGRYLYASENLATFLGMKQSDFLGKTWREAGLPAEFMEPFDVQRRKVMTTGQTVKEELLLPVGNEMRWFDYVVTPMVDAHGDVESVVVSWSDITDRKQGEAAAYRLTSIVESSSDAIFSKTLQGVITTWNGSAEKLFGYAAAEIIGQSISLLVPPDRQQEVPRILERIAAGEAVKNYDTIRLRKDGSSIEVSITLSPIRDPGGRIIGVSTISHDITERKLMAEELAIYSRELERANTELRRQRDEQATLNLVLLEANRVREQFLATMSHELRTPLTSIIGFSQLALDDLEENIVNRPLHDSLERILKNGQHLLSLINDVLDLSKIEAGQMPVSYSQVDVRELLTSVVEEIQPMALAQHLALRTEVAEGVDFLETHPLKLRQVRINLLSNAIKFTEHGEVTISAKRVRSSDTQADSIALAVHDTGIGIPSDVQAHIFEAFYQADGSYTRKVGGTGLGLSIVSQLTTLLGGTIEVTSVPGQGSTFTVLLPIKAVQHTVVQDLPRLHSARQAEVSTVLPSSGEPTSALPGVVGAVPTNGAATVRHNNLVLAIDDNPDSVVLINSALQDTPYTVVGVQDSLQTMELVQELHPCAITLDVMMPNLNGWQILRQLKENPATASIPVVMLSVLSEPTTGYVLGADDYLMKPLMNGVLLNTLHQLAAPLQDSSPASERETQPV